MTEFEPRRALPFSRRRERGPFGALLTFWIVGAFATAPGAAETPEIAATTTTATPASIDPVFDCYSANSAWGLTYSGKVIDRDGRIWSYSQRGKTLPATSGTSGQASFAGAALRGKFGGASAGAQVDATELAAKVALIDKAAAGKITSTDTGVRDAGMSTCHAYVRDGAGGGYRDIELGSDGGVADQRSVNDAPEAKTLLDWLHSLGVAR